MRRVIRQFGMTALMVAIPTLVRAELFASVQDEQNYWTYVRHNQWNFWFNSLTNATWLVCGVVLLLHAAAWTTRRMHRVRQVCLRLLYLLSGLMTLVGVLAAFVAGYSMGDDQAQWFHWQPFVLAAVSAAALIGWIKFEKHCSSSHAADESQSSPAEA